MFNIVLLALNLKFYHVQNGSWFCCSSGSFAFFFGFDAVSDIKIICWFCCFGNMIKSVQNEADFFYLEERVILPY